MLKLITLFHCSAHLILTKTFFIDWERPHVTFETNDGAPPSSDIRKNVKINQPVIWYNELFQLFKLLNSIHFGLKSALFDIAKYISLFKNFYFPKTHYCSQYFPFLPHSCLLLNYDLNLTMIYLEN